MRIAFIALGSQGPGVVGGVQGYLRRLSTGLKALGHEVVFELAGPSPGPALARVHRSTDEALAAALSREPDVVQTTFGLGPAAIARQWSALRQVEHRWGAHMVHPPRPAGRMPMLAQPAFWAAYWATYTGSLVPSPRLRSASHPWGRPVLVPPPARDDHYRIQREPSDGALRFGYAGRLSSDKGLGDVVHVFDALAKRHGERVHCEVFGYGTEIDARPLERRAHVTLTRAEPVPIWTPERAQDMAAFLGRIDVLVLPYRDLATTVDIPLLVVEAMAAGCALVTTNIGDVPWITGPSASIVPIGDVAALEAACNAYVAEPGAARSDGGRLRQRALEWGLTPQGAARAYLRGLGA